MSYQLGAELIVSSADRGLWTERRPAFPYDLNCYVAKLLPSPEYYGAHHACREPLVKEQKVARFICYEFDLFDP